ncbi:MAG TPA: hypothetical protein VGC28_03915 [Sphingomonas sp.]
MSFSWNREEMGSCLRRSDVIWSGPVRRPYKPYVSQTIGELNDKLGWMMLNAPTFKDKTGYFPDRDIENTFQGFNQSLDTLRGKLGEERYTKMREMSDQMRALFESDPESTNGGSNAGRMIIHEMELMLRRKRAAPK